MWLTTRSGGLKVILERLATEGVPQTRADRGAARFFGQRHRDYASSASDGMRWPGVGGHRLYFHYLIIDRPLCRGAHPVGRIQCAAVAGRSHDQPVKDDVRANPAKALSSKQYRA